jgi:hypothetical protein
MRRPDASRVEILLEPAHALLAGMKVIAMPTPPTRDNDFGKATLVVPSLGEVTLQLIDSLG